MTRLARTPNQRTPQLRGAFTALVTPFTGDGALDEAAYRRLVGWQLASGIDGLVPIGTTGESPTVDFDEHRLLIETAVKHAAGRVPIVAGTGVRPALANSLSVSGIS